MSQQEQDQRKSKVRRTCENYVRIKTPTKIKKKTVEGKLQRLLRSIKNVFTERKYKRLHLTGSKLGAFHGNTKVHKLGKGEGLKELTLRPIVSNVGTATYNTAKYLANLLAPLRKSDYTIINTPDFINRLKKERIPTKYKMI